MRESVVELCKTKMRTLQSQGIKRTNRVLGKSKGNEGSEERNEGEVLHDGRGERKE